MLSLNVIDNGLACDCGIFRVLIMAYHRFCKKKILKNGLYFLVYYIRYKALMESYYFLCVKKTLEQIYRNRRLFIRKLFLIAYSSVQNMLFYN